MTRKYFEILAKFSWVKFSSLTLDRQQDRERAAVIYLRLLHFLTLSFGAMFTCVSRFAVDTVLSQQLGSFSFRPFTSQS